MIADQLTAIRRDVEGAMASGPQPGSTALGYVAGTDSQLVVMQCNACGQQRRAIRGEYEQGKYDPKHDPTHAHALALLDEVAAALERERVLRKDLSDCVDVLQMCLSDKNMNVSTDGGIRGCINVLKAALARGGV